MKKEKMCENALHFFLTLVTATLCALGMHVFVYPNAFAPSGVDGFATVLQEITGVNAGIFIFAINAPLLIAAWFVLRRRYVIYTVIYTVLISIELVLLEELSFYQYVAESDLILPALFGGVAQGITGIMLRIGASSGGVDVMGSMIQRKMPHRDVERIISLISVVIVIVSFFVYRNLQSVLLSVIEIFVCERVSAVFLKDSRNAVRFEIVTDRPEEIRHAILYELCHGATVLDGKGLYTGEGKTVIFCIVNYRQIPEFLRILSRHPDAFVSYSDVMGVRGNFDRKKMPPELPK